MPFTSTLVPILEATLTASDATPQSYFASQVALEGDTALLGALGAGDNSGAVYVFQRASGVWAQQQKLVAGDAHPFGSFGAVLALEGDTALIGAPQYDTPGAAYVFVRSGGVWTEQQRLVANDGVIHDQFGYAVALSGDHAFVGAPSVGGDAGAVYAFARAGGVWAQAAKLAGGGAQSFGISVAAQGDRVIVGDAYASYAFSRSGDAFAQTGILRPSGSTVADAPGHEIVASGDTAIVTSGLSHPAHVFSWTGGAFRETASLLIEDSVYKFTFGAASLSGDVAVLGGTPPSSVGGVPGAAHVFARDGATWVHRAAIDPPAGAEHDAFAGAVAVSGSTAIVGASWGHDRAGSAFVYRLEEQPAPPGPQVVYVGAGCAHGAPSGGGALTMMLALAAVRLLRRASPHRRAIAARRAEQRAPARRRPSSSHQFPVIQHHPGELL